MPLVDCLGAVANQLQIKEVTDKVDALVKKGKHQAEAEAIAKREFVAQEFGKLNDELNGIKKEVGVKTGKAEKLKPVNFSELNKKYKADKEAATEKQGTDKARDKDIAKNANSLAEFDKEIRGKNQTKIPDEIKQRYFDALKSLAENNEIDLSHPSAKKYPDIYDILEKKKEQQKPEKQKDNSVVGDKDNPNILSASDFYHEYEKRNPQPKRNSGIRLNKYGKLIDENKGLYFKKQREWNKKANDAYIKHIDEQLSKGERLSDSRVESIASTYNEAGRLPDAEKLLTQYGYEKNINGKWQKPNADIESKVKSIESKAESDNEADLNEAIQKADELITQPINTETDTKIRNADKEELNKTRDDFLKQIEELKDKTDEQSIRDREHLEKQVAIIDKFGMTGEELLNKLRNLEKLTSKCL